MRKLLIVLFFVSSYCNAQYSFEKIVEIDSVSKEALFNRAKFWAMKYFQNPEKVIVTESPEEGFMKLKTGFDYRSEYGSTYSTRYRYDVELYFKDGRYKYILTNFVSPEYGVYKENQSYPKEAGSKRQAKVFDGVMHDISLRLKLQIAVISVSLEGALREPIETEKEW